jgi:hypothetical protein
MTILVLLAALSLVVPQRREAEKPWRLKREIPAWIKSEFKFGYYDRRYGFEEKLYPQYLKGDFNGDGKQDYAIQLRQRAEGKFGIAFFQGKRTQAKPAAVFIAGAGKPVANSSGDFDWVEIWSLYSKAQAYREIQSATLPRFWGDVLKLQTKKGKAGFLYWTGTGYAWYPLRAKPK